MNIKKTNEDFELLKRSIIYVDLKIRNQFIYNDFSNGIIIKNPEFYTSVTKIDTCINVKQLPLNGQRPYVGFFVYPQEQEKVYIKCDANALDDTIGKYLSIYNGKKWVQFPEPLEKNTKTFSLETNIYTIDRKCIGFSVIDNNNPTEYTISNISLVTNNSSNEETKIITFYAYEYKQCINGVHDPSRSVNTCCLNDIFTYFFNKYANLFENKVIVMKNIIYYNKNNLSEDYLIVKDVMDEKEFDYIVQICQNFPKEKRILYLYELPVFEFYLWKLKLFEYFGKVITPIGSIVDMKKYLWCPLYHQLHKIVPDDTYYILNDLPIKTKFLGTNPITSGHNHERQRIARNFASLTDIDIYGGDGFKLYKETKDKYKGLIPLKKHRYHDLTEVLKDYRFVITIENYFTNGYITEKFVDSFMYLSVPIYYGQYKINNIFPEISEGIINGHDFDDIKDLIEYIKNMSDEEYNKKIAIIKKCRDELFNGMSIYNVYEFILQNIFNIKDDSLLTKLNTRFMKQNKILVTTTQYPTNGGGATNSYLLVKYLRSIGYRTACLFFKNKYFNGKVLIEDTNDYNIDPDNLGGMFTTTIDNKQSRGYVINDSGVKIEISKYLEGEPDIILAKNYVAPVLSHDIYKNVPVYYLLSGSYALTRLANENISAQKYLNNSIEPIMTYVETEAMNISKKIVPNSELTKTLISKSYPEHIGKIYHPINTSLLPVNDYVYVDMPKDIDIVYISSDSGRKIKNIDLATNIFKHFKKYDKLLIGKCNVQDIENTTLTNDLISRPNVMKCLAKSKLLICPSFFDSNPNVVYEALANHCIPMLSKNIGTANLFDKIFVCDDVYDENEWYDKIQYVLDNYDKIKNNFDFDKYTKVSNNDELLIKILVGC